MHRSLVPHSPPEEVPGRCVLQQNEGRDQDRKTGTPESTSSGPGERQGEPRGPLGRGPEHPFPPGKGKETDGIDGLCGTMSGNLKKLFPGI